MRKVLAFAWLVFVIGASYCAAVPETMGQGFDRRPVDKKTFRYRCGECGQIFTQSRDSAPTCRGTSDHPHSARTCQRIDDEGNPN